MDKAEAKSMFTEIQENSRKLNSCALHHFDPMPEPYVFGKRSTCHNCGGSMSHMDIHMYCKGFAAAGRDPNLVWPGVRK